MKIPVEICKQYFDETGDNHLLGIKYIQWLEAKIKDADLGDSGKRLFEENEVKEICRNLARICTPSKFIVGIDDRFEEWWKVNFNKS